MRLLALGSLAALCLVATAEPLEDARHGEPVTHAVRARASIAVDGRLDEAAWAAAPVASGFLQREPQEGAPASEPTELRVVFDDAALYVGARLFDDEPKRVARQLSRRDDVVEADTFTLFLDPHHDHRNGVAFQVSAAGVQRDAVLYDDNFESNAWDAVWESAVTRDGEGWTVEMKIPFSQLRFPAAAGHVWGLNARRIVHRKAEESWLALVPRNQNGLVSRMAHLEGIEISARSRWIRPSSTSRPTRRSSRRSGPSSSRAARSSPTSRGRARATTGASSTSSRSSSTRAASAARPKAKAPATTWTRRRPRRFWAPPSSRDARAPGTSAWSRPSPAARSPGWPTRA